MKTTIEIRRERILNIFGTDSPPLWLVRQKRDKYLARLKNRLVKILERENNDEEMLQRCIHAVATLKTTSIGSLQRSQRLSYTRAEILATEMIRRGIIERDETDKWKLIVCNPKENISETEKPIANK